MQRFWISFAFSFPVRFGAEDVKSPSRTLKHAGLTQGSFPSRYAGQQNQVFLCLTFKRTLSHTNFSQYFCCCCCFIFLLCRGVVTLGTESRDSWIAGEYSTTELFPLPWALLIRSLKNTLLSLLGRYVRHTEIFSFSRLGLRLSRFTAYLAWTKPGVQS